MKGTLLTFMIKYEPVFRHGQTYVYIYNLQIMTVNYYIL